MLLLLLTIKQIILIGQYRIPDMLKLDLEFYIQCYYSQFTNWGNQRVTYLKKKSSLKELG